MKIDKTLLIPLKLGVYFLYSQVGEELSKDIWTKGLSKNIRNLKVRSDGKKLDKTKVCIWFFGETLDYWLCG